MTFGFVLILSALAYLGVLFLVAHFGDRRAGRALGERRSRAWIYPLSLAVYCTSWTFFGSVGLASRQGYDFLAIYVGPILLWGLMWPLLTRVVQIAKAQNITSIADFIGARFGKSQTVAATVCLIVTVGTIPYLALQLKAVSASLLTTLEPAQVANVTQALPFFGDLALLVAMAMAAFAMLFGTRHADATEHQDGLILAVAMESLVKLICFLAVGLYVTYGLFSGPGDLLAKAAERADIVAVATRAPDFGTFAAMSVLSFCCAILLPRMFHVGVVENRSTAELRRAAWLFPLYLVAINLFVVPIAIAGLLSFPPGAIDSDMTVIALPLSQGNELMTMAAFIGGLSAATAMVIVASVALSIMISNDLVIPALIKLRELRPVGPDFGEGRAHLGELILQIRRTIILVVLMAAYVYNRVAGDAQLASIGLLSFAAVAQIAPAFFGGLFWQRVTARGAVAGMIVGLSVWGYTLFLPMLAQTGSIGNSIVAEGLFGLSFLRPQALFGLNLPPLAHGVFWSLLLNGLALFLGTLSRKPLAIEQLQANIFAPTAASADKPSFRLWRSSVSVKELELTVARYLGTERTATAFEAFATSRGVALVRDSEADIELLRYAEHLLASAIGAASSRLVLSMLLRKRTVSTEAALTLLDGAHAAIQYNREMMQTALEHARQGVSIFDADLKLMVWNKPFADTLDLAPGALRIGMDLSDMLNELAARGEFGPGDRTEQVSTRIEAMLSTSEPRRERLYLKGLVVEIRSARLPDGGYVTTYTDVTSNVAAEEELERANERLEQRVRERTEELTLLNAELARAKAEADEANLSKTRFLAAASHDILQPLNAARLYTTSLVERRAQAAEADPRTASERLLVENVDASLEAVEEILSALLDISRLDAGAMTPEVTSFRLDDVFRQLAVEFTPVANARGLTLTFVPTSLAVRSDRRLLRRVLQNLISNAIKYTPKGRVLIGCRRRGDHLRIDVIDTGPGIAQSKQKIIFQEFQRLEQGAKVARGLGLGLSIVERMARVLGHPLKLRSKVGKGSTFSVEVPRVVAPAASVAAPAPQRTPGFMLEGMVVVAIDNEPTILDAMRSLISGWGCRIVTAIDASEAIVALDQTGLRPDVLLVDYHLDEGSGFDALGEMQKRYGAALPAVLITADRSAAVRDEATAAGISLLNKPLKPAALRALLAQIGVRREAAE